MINILKEIDWQKLKNEHGSPNVDPNIWQNIFYNVQHGFNEYLKGVLYETNDLPENDILKIVEVFKTHFPEKDRNPDLKGKYFDDRLNDSLLHYQSIKRSKVLTKILQLEFEYRKKYDSYRISKIVDSYDVINNPQLESSIGKEMSCFKPIQDFDDALERLIELSAKMCFQKELKDFH